MRWLRVLAVFATVIASWMPVLASPVAGPASSHLAATDGPAKIRFGLLTYGPAGTIMSQFGHAAIVVFDGEGRRELYELATESPDHRYSVPWYLTSQKLIYQSQKGPLSATLHSAFLQFRDVQLRVLNLTDDQQSRLASLIARELKPDRVHFEFGVYTSNCTTRIRDLLDAALGGQLQRQLVTSPATMSFRDHSLRAFASRPLTAISLDLALGRLSDRTPTRWDESFIPETLALSLDEIMVTAHPEAARPLVESVSTLLIGKPSYRMPPQPPDFTAGLAVTGAVLWMLLVLARSRDWPAVGQVERALLAAFGSLGLFLMYLWFVGGERVASWNENILVFNPLLLALVATRPGRIRSWSSKFVLAGLLLAVLLKFVPYAQANIGWILFAGPSITYLTIRSMVPSAWLESIRRRGTDNLQESVSAAGSGTAPQSAAVIMGPVWTSIARIRRSNH
jgi:hypothetical protein